MIKSSSVETKKINHDVQENYDTLWKNEWHDLHKIGPGVRTRNRILLKFFKKYITTGTVLDIGCGDGSFLIKLHNAFQNSLQYNAGDISEEVLQILKLQSFIDECFLLDLENQSTLPSQKYTAVISSEVLEHLEDWQAAINSLSDLVDNSGFIFITVPAQMKYWGPHDEFALHYRRFEIGQIENVLKAHGFCIKESKCWGWPFYWLYYSFVLNKTSPQKVMKEATSSFKKLASTILFALFLFDDLFSTPWGRRLFVVAQKPASRGSLSNNPIQKS